MLYTLRPTTQYGNPVGLPLITSQITIEGNGAIISRPEDAPDFGLMAVRGNVFLGVGVPPGPRGDLTLQGVTLSGGSSFGGFSNNGNASIKNSVISGNTGSGVSNSGTLTIQNSTISGNTTPGGGGGVYNYVGTVAITEQHHLGQHRQVERWGRK